MGGGASESTRIWCVIMFYLFLGQFPEMEGFIHGEESNKFENGLGKDFVVIYRYIDIVLNFQL